MEIMCDHNSLSNDSKGKHNESARNPARKKRQANRDSGENSPLQKRRRQVILNRLQRKLENLQRIQLSASVELYYHRRSSELSTSRQDESIVCAETSEEVSNCLPSSSSKSSINRRVSNQRRSSRHGSADKYNTTDSSKFKSEEDQVITPQFESQSHGFADDTLKESDETTFQDAAKSLDEVLQNTDVKLIKLIEQEAMSQVSKEIGTRASNLEEPQSENQEEDLLFDVNHVDVEELLRDVNPEDVEKLLDSEDMDAMLQEMTEDESETPSVPEDKKRKIKTDSDSDRRSENLGEESDEFESDDAHSSNEAKRLKVESPKLTESSHIKREPEVPSKFNSSSEYFSFMKKKKLSPDTSKKRSTSKWRGDVLAAGRGLRPGEREKSDDWKRASDKLLSNLAKSDFVSERVRHLNWHGLWSENRLPKVAEMPRTRTHWDFVIEELKWMSADFVQEQRWKRHCCRVISNAVVQFAPKLTSRTNEVKETWQRHRAKVIASKVVAFWNNAEVDFVKRTYPDSIRRLPDMSLIPSDHKDAIPCPKLKSENIDEGDLKMSPDESDDECFSLDNSEIVQRLTMCSKQRKLYDDYLADPKTRNAFESDDPTQMSIVLKNLLTICNYPNPQMALKSKTSIPDGVTFPRVHDLWSLPRQILRATEYRPLEAVCPRNFFEMFLPHESGYSVVVYDWLRKHYARAEKMREPDRNHDMQLVSFEECKWDKTSLSFKGQPKIKLSKENRASAFHEESLDTLARMNAGRRFSEPLLGQDLCDSFTVLDTITPSRGRNLGRGYVNCLVASSETWNKLATIETDATFSLKLPWTTMCLGGSGRSSKRKHCYNPRYVTKGLEKLVKISAQFRLPSFLSEMTSGIQLAPSYNCSVSELQKRLEPNLSLLQSEEKFISKYSCSIKPTNNTQMSLTMSRISVKIKKLDNVLRKLRTKNRRALIICRSMDMFSIVREHLKRSHFSSIFLDPEENEEITIFRIQFFCERTNVQVLLVSAYMPVLGYVLPDIDCVIAVDMGIIGMNGDPSKDTCLINYKNWCKLVSLQNKKPRIIRFVCEGTIEDECKIQGIQKELLQLDDQLDQTKPSFVFNNPDLISPLHKYSLEWLDQFFVASPFIEERESVLTRCSMIENFEENCSDIVFQRRKKDLNSIVALKYMDIKGPWLNKLGDEMPLWYPGNIFEADVDGDFGRDFLQKYYRLELMEEFDLPPVWVDDEPSLDVVTKQTHGQRFESLLLKGVPREQINGIRKKRHNPFGIGHSIVSKHSIVGSLQSGEGLPRTLFHPRSAVPRNVPKQRDPTAFPEGSQPSTDATLAAVNIAIANLRHPVPRQQIAESGVPEWSPTEDVMLLTSIKSSMRSRFHRNPFDSVINWSLVSDIVNSVSHYFRSDEQCRKHFTDIVRPREEGRTGAPQPLLPVPPQTNPKKKKSGGSLGSTLGNSGRIHKTDELFQNDNNLTFTKLACERFSTIKNVSNRRAPTTKPVVQMSVADLGESIRVLAESSINYYSPIGPVELAQRRQINRRQPQVPTSQDGQAASAARSVAVAQGGTRPNQVGQIAVVGTTTSTPIELVRQLRHPQPQQIQAHQLQAHQMQIQLRAQQLQAQVRQQQPQQIRQITNRQQLQPQVPIQRAQQIQQIRQQIALQQHTQTQQNPRQQSPQQTQSQQRPQTQHIVRQQLTHQQVGQLQQQIQQQQLVVVQQPRQQSPLQTQQQRPQQLQLVVQQQQQQPRPQVPLQAPVRPQPAQPTAQHVRPQQQQQQIRPQQAQQTLQVRPQQPQLAQQSKSTELSIQQQQQIRPQQYHRLQQIKQPQQVRLVHPQTQAKLIMRCDVGGQGTRDGESRPAYQILTQENLQKVIHGMTGQLVLAAPSSVVQQSNQPQTSSSVGQIIVNSQNMNIVNARVSGASSQAPTGFPTTTQAGSATRGNILTAISTQGGRTISRIVPINTTRQTSPRTTTGALSVGSTNLLQFQGGGLMRTTSAGDTNLSAVRFQVAVGNNRVQGTQQGQPARSFVTATQRQGQTVVPVHQIQQVVRSAIGTSTTPSITVVNTTPVARAPNSGQQSVHGNSQHVVTLGSLNHATPVVVVQSPQNEASRTSTSQQGPTTQVRIAPNAAAIRVPASANSSPIQVLTRPATTTSEIHSTKPNPGFTKL